MSLLQCFDTIVRLTGI